ncbi:ABC transporter substrate-binding protein [Leptolyngbya sp. CCY15150]|uniref:ABC transporter substrate-binding protein n=1 Tax=Leptolyngbya sp. CCY15150 TaxID=2767772 RepID=UPI001EF1868C|nr:ABC transporter substrate-binding protein [Leptolyngbya sp. CCY15150]
MTKTLNNRWNQRRSLWWAALLAGAIAFLCVGAILSREAQRSPELAQRLTMSFPNEPKTFNVALNEESPNVFDGVTYASLLRQNGLTGELLPNLAESWQVSEDGQRIVFTLRPAMQWSDGQPLTVDDVVFTFNDVCFNPAVPTLLRDSLRIGESGALPTVQQVGDRQVEIISPEPFAPLLRNMGGVPIMPRHALASALEPIDGQPLPFLSTWGTDTPAEQIVSSGPFRMVQYIPGQRLVFEQNPGYWAWNDAASPQPVQEMVWQIVDSPDTALMQFRSGGLDAVGASASNFGLLKREESRGQFTIYNGGPALSTSYLMFNLNRGQRPAGQPLVDPVKSAWFNQKEFRQAIAHGIDRQTLINNIFQGLGTVQHASIALQSPFYLSPDDGLPTYAYDPSQGIALLESVGFTYDAAGQLLDADGNRVEFTLMHVAGSGTTDAIATQIQRDLGRLGIRVTLQALSFNAIVDRITLSLDWEAQILGTTNSLEPHSGISAWSPEGRLHDFNLRPDADDIIGREVADWEAEIGRLYVQASQATDFETRYQLYAEAQKLAQEYMPIIHLVNPLSLVAVRDRIQGIQFSAIGHLLWNVHEFRMLERSPDPEAAN